MRKTLTPAERLIVAADFKPTDQRGYQKRVEVLIKVLKLADSLKGTSICLKVNTALRACGYDLIDEIHARGLKVFADLKLFDIDETLSTDGILLREAKPELLTAALPSGIEALKRLKAELPDTEVLGVGVLTTLTDKDTDMMWDRSISFTADKLGYLAVRAGLDGIICAATEARGMRSIVGPDRTIISPAIRPAYTIVPGDDQNPELIMTPAKAIAAGVDRIVVGRPIILAPNPYDAARRIIDEIASVRP